MQRSGLATVALTLIAQVPSLAMAAAEPYAQVNFLGSPGNAEQMIYSSDYRVLVLRNAGSAIRVLDLETGAVATHLATYNFRDMSLSPDGRYVFVADYGGENIGYGTPANQHEVSRLDLETGVFETKATPGIAAHIEATAADRFILSSQDQWITFTYQGWGDGDATTILNAGGCCWGGGFYAGAYSGDIEFDVATQRLIHGNSGSSSSEIAAYQIVNNGFQYAEESGIYGTASGYGGSSVLATDGSVFYYGALQVDALDVRSNLRAFPKIIRAANADTAFAQDAYYDAATGSQVGQLGFSTTVYALNRAGRDFWAYDPGKNLLRHFVPASDVPNLPPSANLDVVAAPTGVQTVIAPLANDVGFADPVTITILSGPEHGSATVSGSPGDRAGVRINYQPAGSYTGPDSLVYEISDGTSTDTATVAIDVVPAKAFNDAAVILPSYSTSIKVLANDVGFKNPVTVTILTYPTQGGSVSVSGSPGNASGISISYYAYSYGKPLPYTDTFTYRVSDGTHTDTATVSVEVVEYRAQDDLTVTGQGQPVEVGVLANDLGFSYQRQLLVYTNPQHGAVAITGDPGNQSITYTPAPGYLGSDYFEYAVDDGTRSDIARVDVRVITDADGDRIDDGVDNCLGAANPGQQDGDGDGYGNWCDADLNNDNRTNFADVAAFRALFGSTDSEADLDANGVVNFADLGRLRALFGKSPGPSALVP